ncbi:MAG TPA: PhzF family phenazine biosynthesis protein [Smithellaceae bacterium]|nr:PhzF family phenazine biosynthesis protein [Smithellaceae bacterium]
MKIPLYQVDAFTSRVFSGNPAAVCLLDGWPDDTLLQSIAAENNLSETAFLVRRGAAVELRWFTPRVEVALCGHATLAAAYVLFVCKQWMQDRIPFLTRSRGELTVTRKGDLIEMDFPALPALRSVPAASLKPALGVTPMKCLASEEDLLAVLDSEDAVRKARPDLSALAAFDCRGVIITAQGNTSDFVSRFFAPRVGISEDPVTGSAHCVLAPYWADQLGRTDLRALQVSARGGEIFCRYKGNRVHIAGRAVLYLEGEIRLP